MSNHPALNRSSFIGIGRIDGNCGWTTCRSAMELECARPHIAIIFVPGHPAPATRAAADIHQRAFGKIENKLGSRVGRHPKRNVGVGLDHYGERGAGAHGKRHRSGEHSDQSAYPRAPLSIRQLGTGSPQIHAALRKTNRFLRGTWSAGPSSRFHDPPLPFNEGRCKARRSRSSSQLLDWGQAPGAVFAFAPRMSLIGSNRSSVRHRITQHRVLTS